MPVELKDFSVQIKAKMDEVAKGWLTEWAHTVASVAKDNCQMDDDGQLRGSYRADVDLGAGEARIGTPLESGYWEEYGTGEYAVHGDGRKGWWVYKDGYEGRGGKQLTEEQAKAIAAGKSDVHATNGRRPAATLENAFVQTKPKMEADLEQKLGGTFA